MLPVTLRTAAPNTGPIPPHPSPRQPPCVQSAYNHYRVPQERQMTPKKYPLDYPIRLTADGTRVCRFHNYGTCKKHATGACPLDHSHCHACGAHGHAAASCPALPSVSDTA